jgi:carbonic anhydrase
MRKSAPSTAQHDRRSFLTITGITVATTILGVAPSSLVDAAALTKGQRDKLTADDIIALMKKGNEPLPRRQGVSASATASMRAWPATSPTTISS